MTTVTFGPTLIGESPIKVSIPKDTGEGPQKLRVTLPTLNDASVGPQNIPRWIKS